MKPHLKHLIRLATMAVMITCGNAAEERKNPPPVRGLQEVGQAQVELGGGFWGTRLKTVHEVTIPHALDELEKGGHVTNFDKAAGRFDGPLKGHHAFDSDPYKALEGALHSLKHHDDPALRQRVAGILTQNQTNDGPEIRCFSAYCGSPC